MNRQLIIFTKALLLFSITQCIYSQNPNFIIILSDDQDLALGGMTPMTKTQTLIANNGINFTNAFVTTPVCCPSRTSILTGLYQHNHQAVNNSLEGNCFGEAWREELEPQSFAVALKASGYRTFYAGKYLNQYGYTEEGATHVPPGWDWWVGLLGNSRYYNYTLSINGTGVFHENDYLTDLITSYGLEFLRQTDVSASGFMMVLAPPAAHAPFTPSPTYTDYYRNVTALKTPNFNVPVGEDKHWLLRMPPSTLPESTLTELDEIYRNRWETLLSVDDMVEAVINELDSLNILNNTYVLYTSDHGFHIGQFALPWDKRQPYEFDIRVPLLVRGPGIPANQVVSDPVLNIDLAPTILDIANVSSLLEMDGKSFKNSLSGNNVASERGFLVEYVGEGDNNRVDSDCDLVLDDNLTECTVTAACKCQDSRNNTYTCLRYLSDVENILYCSFNDSQGFQEAYDLNMDPYQMDNLAYDLSVDVKTQYEKKLFHLTSCAGAHCNSFP